MSEQTKYANKVVSVIMLILGLIGIVSSISGIVKGTSVGYVGFL